MGFRRHLERKVIVLDKIPPIIELNGDDTISIFVNNKYEELGANATDNYDGDLTDKIKINSNFDNTKIGTYCIDYYVEDSSKNNNSITRTIIVKKREETKPICNYTNSISKYICDNNLNVSVEYYNLVTGDTYFYKQYIYTIKI